MPRKLPFLLCAAFVFLMTTILVVETVCRHNRRPHLFVERQLTTERQLRETFSAPDTVLVTTADALAETGTATLHDYALVRGRADGRRIRVLVWRIPCLCSNDSITAFLDATTGRVLYVTASYRL